jgi:hypothetical protein
MISNTLPIPCLFCAPKAATAEHDEATSGNPQTLIRTEVKVESTRGAKAGQKAAKDPRIAC